jgi:hypothetical protein
MASVVAGVRHGDGRRHGWDVKVGVHACVHRPCCTGLVIDRFRRAVVPRILEKIKEFSRSPQGRRTTEQVRRAAADPRRRSQAQKLLGRLRGRH